MSFRLVSKRWFPAFILAVLLALGTIPSVAADDWCDADPIVRLDGTNRVQILVSIPAQHFDNVTSATRVEIQTPASVGRELLYTDDGFNGLGEQVTFGNLPGGVATSSGYLVYVRVVVPIQASNPVVIRVRIIPDNGPEMVTYGLQTGTVVYLWVNR
jgi:hypothetical protein